MSERRLRHGVFPGAGAAWPDLVKVWQQADELGYDSCWIPDHFYSGGQNPEAPCLEAWTALSAMAALTQRIKLGPMVLGNTYRHPAVVANMTATLDQVSGGRLQLGMGAGWMVSEHEAYNIPLPPPAERLDRLDEALQVIKLLLTQKRSNFEGRYYRLRDALSEPKPLQSPHPPIVVGGGGEKRTLRVVAKHANEWNGEASPAQMAHKIRVLHEHCRAVGRDPSEIAIGVLLRTELQGESTYQSWVRGGSPIITQERERLSAEGYAGDELEQEIRKVIWTQFLPIDEERAIERLNEYAAVGVSHFIVIRPAPFDHDLIDHFMARVVPHVRTKA